MQKFGKIAAAQIPKEMQNQPITKSTGGGITQNSRTSIQIQPSKPELNAGEIIGDIIDRFRRGLGWKLKAAYTNEERLDYEHLIVTFLEQLGAAQIPVREYERLYRRATVTRGRRRAEGKENSFHITPEEIIAEWFALKKAEQTPPEKSDLENCPERAKHLDDETLREYLYGGTVEIVLPCHVCRPQAHAVRRADFISRHNESFAGRRLPAAPPEVVAADNQKTAFGGKFERQAEENLSDEEIANLLSKYHILVSQIVTDEEDRKSVEIVFDEGANCFKMRNSYQTFSPKVLRKKIEDYQKILESRSK